MTKKTCLMLTAGLTVLMPSASDVQAAPIEYTTVAIEDTLAAMDNIGSSEAAEAQYMADYLGVDLADVNYGKIDLDGPTSWMEVINEPSGDLWAIDFGSFGIIDPVIFMVKLGNAVYSHYLYDNEVSLNYGVIDLSKIDARAGNITISSLSHTATAGSTTTVPEPSSLVLLMLGLGILPFARRRS